MNIIYNPEEKQGERFTEAHQCGYCGEPCEGKFCCEVHANLFYAEDDEAREAAVYNDDEDEVEWILREEKRAL